MNSPLAALVHIARPLLTKSAACTCSEVLQWPFVRWEYQLRPWLLQHRAGTLNLPISRMLAHHLASNFPNIHRYSFRLASGFTSFTPLHSIDWPSVAARGEFAGHTEGSLRSEEKQIWAIM